MMVRVGMAMALMFASVTATGDEAHRVTFSEDVAPIMFENCASCHRPGEVAPFSVLDYDAVRPWAKSIRKVVGEGTMPPWHADSSKVAYKNERSLTPDAVETILAWVDQGAREGDRAHLPEQPVFNETWSIGEPDMIFNGENDFLIPAFEQEIAYQSIHLAPQVDEDLYIQSWEIRSTVRKSVHHANLVRAPLRLQPVGIGQAVMRGGDYIGSYLPGAKPIRYPEGTALIIPKDSIIQIQVHYVGQDEPVKDHVMWGVKFARGRVDQVVRTVGTDEYEIEIAPHGTFAMDSEVTLNYPLTLFSSGAHMHLRGNSYTTTAVFPDGTEKLITDVPNYDFNWQSNYELAEPVSVPKGTRYRVHATWDNTENNPINPNPDQKVVYGRWTENEMLTTWSHAVVTGQKLGLRIENGRVVGKYDDAIESVPPGILQTLPSTFRMPRKTQVDSD